LENGNHVEFLFQLSDQVSFNLNKKQVCTGKSLVRDEIKKYYASNHRYNHTFLNVWEVDDTYTITADLEIKSQHVETKDIPWIAIVKMHQGKIGKIELFADF
jgi:hypothetical protein